MEEGRILLYKEICHLPASVSWYTEARGGVAGWLAIRFVHKGDLFAGN